MKKNSSNNSGSQFSIDMDSKGVVIFLVLVALTAGSVFYLGMLFGKAGRNAHEKVELKGVAGEPAPDTLKPPTDLKIYDLGGKTPEVNALQKEFNSLQETSAPTVAAEFQALDQEAKDMETLKAQAKTLDQEPTPTETEAPEASKPKAESGAWPDIVKETTEKSNQPLFTVQVLGTGNRAKADALVDQLKSKNFDAFVESLTSEGKQIYRVRVGRENSEKIEKVKDRLEPYIKGLGQPAVVPLH
ncbi:MAG: hypothetical protein A2600_09080 [Candidatus Lambdaproteobacteria bacterium RIFOXYD1_FULL_56_27]|nr:MAG: hypothetical protein A2426_10500 [Candidatus Lambdaproteobacteria bacterium RIFOXYC1_FULL_56_13]OGH06681.1 MAG: hypothetical protein A2600_09080 [Candidatus Lambdaproteobacteria bacterium RIFOXYD1_FULL_56_27]